MKEQKKSWKRRQFLATGIGGLVGMGTLRTPAASTAAQNSPSPSRFIYRVLGKTKIRLPIVSMGVMNADNPNLVKAALDAGIVMLDTAHGYQRGRNEEMIGQVIRGRPRDSYVIATKVPGMPMTREGLYTAETTGESFLQKLDISLKRLGLDAVDILYLHNVWKAESTRFEPLIKALEKAKKDGKTRFVGLSTHQNEPEVLRAVADSGFYDVVLTSINFREDHHLETRSAIAQAAKAGIGIVAMKTQAGVYWDKEKLLKIDMKAALKWVLQDTNIHTAIPGFTSFDQIAEDLSVMENLALSEKEKAALVPPANMTGLYCQQCGHCLAQCRERLPIPDLMRGYMYARAYGNFSAARDLVASLALPAEVCRSCVSCDVRCAKDFPVSTRIREIAAIRNLPESLLA